jgi:HlyD family secretion protein
VNNKFAAGANIRLWRLSAMHSECGGPGIYVPETDLSRIHAGDVMQVQIDGSKQTLDGTVGYISSVAEFTPKTVQTEELRTSLVYEVRVQVEDPDNILRLGMPATVTFKTAH